MKMQHISQWDMLSEYLKEWGRMQEIKPRVYNAYVLPDARLFDICEERWFHGEERPHGVVSLPWRKDGAALKQAVLRQCFRHHTWPVVAP